VKIGKEVKIMARNNSIDSYIDMVGEYFKKLPELPRRGREAVVVITPWLALVFGVLGVITALVGLGVFTFLAPLAMIVGARGAGAGFVIVLLGLVSSALLLMAFPGTKSRRMNGWKLIYYSEVVGIIADIVSLSLSGVLFALIGFYFLYQIRSYYK
jgi:hypothetical protein